MQVTNVFYITKEDQSTYVKTEFDTKHYTIVNDGDTRFTVMTPKGRIANDAVAYRAILAINSYYDQLWN